MRVFPLVAAVGVLLAWARPTWANGAFPDSQAILLPSSRPEQIFVSTNFGLLRSDDGGQSWGWVCEEAIGPSAFSYQVGPAPDHRLFAVTSTSVVMSDDAGCSFRAADGLQNPTDVFPDPNDPERVMAIALADADGDTHKLNAIYVSEDGGRSFGVGYAAQTGVYIASVESARAEADVVYLGTSIYDGRSWHPSLKRSTDRGRSFEGDDLQTALGAVVPRLLLVDPRDASRVYLRLQGSGERDAFATYEHPGGVARAPFELNARMTAFALRADGTLLLGNAATQNFISTDGGESFTHWHDGLHLRALAERDGALYLAADDQLDGFALAEWSDADDAPRPLLRFANITGPLGCGDLVARCEEPWRTLQETLAQVALPDAGAEPGPGADAGSDAGASTPQPDTGSGGCSLAPHGDTRDTRGAAPALLLAALACSRLRRRRAKQPG